MGSYIALRAISAVAELLVIKLCIMSACPWVEGKLVKFYLENISFMRNARSCDTACYSA